MLLHATGKLQVSKAIRLPDWHYQPLRLLRDEMANPVEVVTEFFSGYTLPQVRKHFREMLASAISAAEVCPVNCLTLYNNLEKLIEAAWLIGQRKTIPSLFSASPVSQDITALIQLLTALVRPERVFLLSPKESADVDILIIVPDNAGKPFSHYGTLIETLSYGMHLSFSLHLSSAFRQHIEEAHPFWMSCCTEQKQVYTSVTTPFPRCVPGKTEGLIEKMRIIFLTGMERSSSLLGSAQANRLSGNNAVTLFLLHQSAELLFRALILSLTGTEVREHNITVLRKHLRRCAPEVYHLFPGDTAEDKALLSLLDAAYRKGRYDEGFSPGKEQVNTLFKRIEGLHSTADTVFSAVIRLIIKEE